MPKFYTTYEVAEMLKMSEETVRRWINAGKIRASMLGGSKNIRITEDALNQFIADTEIKN